jgi:hypothetical protein
MLMQFFRRHQFIFLFLAVVVLSCILVVRQYLADETAHIEAREDFIVLNERGHATEAERFYQRLVQELTALSEKTLLDDLQRTVGLVDPNTQHPDNLVWKYHWAVRQQLEKRSERRLKDLLDQARHD